MMAFDRTPAPQLDAETVDSLRSVMDRALRRGNHGNELQDVLTRAAAEARDKAIPPEQLLIIMKDLWHSLPELRRTTDSEKQTELLQELISRCIERYYDT
jgi:hypothetical protein